MGYFTLGENTEYKTLIAMLCTSQHSPGQRSTSHTTLFDITSSRTVLDWSLLWRDALNFSALFSAILYNTLYFTMQYSTVRYITILFSTTHLTQSLTHPPTFSFQFTSNHWTDSPTFNHSFPLTHLLHITPHPTSHLLLASSSLSRHNLTNYVPFSLSLSLTWSLEGARSMS